MSALIRNVLGVAATIGILAAAGAMVMAASSYSSANEPTVNRTFSVTAQGEAVAVPDVASFTYGVVTQGGLEVDDLRQENVTAANAINAYLKSEGVEQEDIRTQGFNITPRYASTRCMPGEECPSPEITGYEVRQTVSVKVRDFDLAGELLTGVSERGANNVSRLSFEIDDPTAVETEARADAVSRARDKAEELARAGGFRVGDIVSISEGAMPQPMYRDLAASEVRGLGEGGAAPQLEPGSEEVTVSVSVTYEIR